MSWHESAIVCVLESARAGFVLAIVRHATYHELEARTRRACAARALYDRERLELRLLDAHRREITSRNYASFRAGALDRVFAPVRDVP